MNGRWQAGDIAILLKSFKHPEYVGRRVKVLSDLRPASTPQHYKYIRQGSLVYAVDLPMSPEGLARGAKHTVVLPEQLGPLPPCAEPGTWEDCVWTPTILETVE